MPIKSTTKIVTKTFRVPFEIKGNIDSSVQKGHVDKGNGFIDSSSGGQTVTISASLINKYETGGVPNYDSKRCVRMTMNYVVKEDNWKVKGYENKDLLCISQMDYPIPIQDFLDEGYYEEKDTEGRFVKKIIPRDLNFYPSNEYKLEFYAARYFEGGSPHKYANYTPLLSGENVAQDKKPQNLANWLSDVQVKFDGQALTGKGNMAIKGIVEFTLGRTDEITEFIYTDPIMGNERKVENFHSSVDTVLGRGYDICGNYANRLSCRDKVVDYEKLNEYKRIKQALGIRYSNSASYTGENIREYTSDRESQMNIKVGASAFGASFSKETKETFSKHSETKTGHRFATLKQFTQRETYQVQGYDNPSVMTDFLTPQFLEDLNTQSADYIIKHYGTHVVLGMVVGASFWFNMDYQQSLIKQSTATTYSDKTALEFDDKGLLLKPVATQSAESVTESLFKAINEGLNKDNVKDYADFLKAITEYLSKVPDGNFNTKTSWGDEYSESIKNSLMEEDKSEEHECHVVGGNDALALTINSTNDLSKLEEWAKTVNENSDFCDFIPGTLIPIEELVPTGFKLSQKNIKEASNRYQSANNKSIPNSYKRGVKIIEFDTMRYGTTTPIDCIGIIETKDKPVKWELNIELMNFDDGYCGFAISLLVTGETPDGWRGTDKKTVILNTYTDVIKPAELGDFSSIAIDTDHQNLVRNGKKITSFSAIGNWNRELTDWASAAKEVKAGSAYRVIDMNSPIEVHLDDPHPYLNPGSIIVDQNDFQINIVDDLKNIGVRGKIMIPWVAC